MNNRPTRATGHLSFSTADQQPDALPAQDTPHVTRPRTSGMP